MPYDVYSTYMQASNQANRDKKLIKKAQTIPKLRKLYKSWKISQKYVQKGYMRGDTINNKTIKTQNKAH